MWEHVIIVIIVLLAAAYVLRGLRRAATGKTACAQDGCTGCPFSEGCGHCGEETDCAHPNETEHTSP
jgi:hypothetical protein